MRVGGPPTVRARQWLFILGDVLRPPAHVHSLLILFYTFMRGKFRHINHLIVDCVTNMGATVPAAGGLVQSMGRCRARGGTTVPAMGRCVTGMGPR